VFDSDWESPKDDYVYESQAQAPKPAFPYQLNELVEHTKFGLGRIKEIVDMGEDSIVVIKFNSGNTKSLMLKYAKLRKVGA
jgi:hypothetical protein